MSETYDVLIRNGRIVDGTGGVWYRGDVGVRGDRIAAIGTLQGQAKEVIDARDRVVCPGFVDILTIAPLNVIGEPLNETRTLQGVTTIHVGLCGNSPAPLTDKIARDIERYLTPVWGDYGIAWDWRSVDDYLRRVTNHAAVNVTLSCGITTLWVEAVGWHDRRATAREIARMQELAAQAMEDGAAGFSTGAYAPSEWCSHEECVEICKVLAPYGGVYFSHLRSIASDDPFAPLKEAIAVGEEAGIPVHVEHLKTINERMYRRADEMLAVIDQARARGIDVTMDCYPYLAGSGSFWPPTWAHEDGPDAMMARLKKSPDRDRLVDEFNRRDPAEWQRRYIADVKAASYKHYEGKSFAEAIAASGKSAGEFLCDYMFDNDLTVQHVSHGGNEDDVRRVMQHPAYMVSSDSIHVGSKPHPRTYGNYPKYLGRYVREMGILRLEECIRMMTSAPAQCLGLMDRGILRPGMAADITIFDPDTIIDRSTFENPRQFAVGVDDVIVNGRPIVSNGKATGALPGRGLKRQARA
jgi:N-acyl-D-amino-acid deacylase